jgi:hypothetical protein
MRMDGTIVPIPGELHQTELEALCDLCGRARSLEELLLWVDERKRITVNAHGRGARRVIEFSFSIDDDVVAVLSVSAAGVVSRIPDFEPLCEQARTFDDQPGYRPDDSWFDARNNRLGLYDNHRHQMNFAPPQAVLELVCSYALSSSGFAEISNLQLQEGEGEARAIKIALMFTAPTDTHGWYETAAVYKSELHTHLADRFWN